MEPRHLSDEAIVELRFIDIFDTTLHIGGAAYEAVTMGEYYLSEDLNDRMIST